MSDVALFVHSTGMGPFMWKPFLAGVPSGIQSVAPANRGYTPADLLARGTVFSLSDEVAHLKAQIPDGTTGLHLGGHSYGGLVALTLAMQSELPVKSMWLYEPVLFGSLKAEAAQLPPDAAEHVARLFGDPDFLLNDETGGHEAWLAAFVDYWNQPGTWASMSDKAKAMARLVGWKMFQEVRMVATESQAFAHYQLGMPITLVHGEHTTPPAREMVRRLAQVNAHAVVDSLPGLGHMGLVSAPDQVEPSLARHWARLARAVGAA
jgi:pimeloyl-ACP methyl ester carboxylesterase